MYSLFDCPHRRQSTALACLQSQVSDLESRCFKYPLKAVKRQIYASAQFRHMHKKLLKID